ncbi:MAG: lactoylglutathione lyase [Lysobacteraceae bacterium]|nr:MAG: lactoylglutathione lyase [Xanthomonadaceae bacterium]
MKYLHTMVRVRDIAASLHFYCEGLGLKEKRRMEDAKGRYTLVFLAADETPDAEIELTWNWPGEDGAVEEYGSGRNFGHLAFRVSDIYATCDRLQSLGYTINRPPRDGHMAFVRSPDMISVELLQDGTLPPREPWASMPNTGHW